MSWQEETVECPECGFEGPPRTIDYYDTDLPACRNCGATVEDLVDDRDGHEPGDGS